jgi:YHS domain-containing protein
MDTLLSLLVFGVLFFFMMRFGCGAHMSHGRRHEHRHSGGRNPDVVIRDPVCGMEVPTDNGYSKIVGDREFRFCSRRCLDEFEAAPAHRHAA